MVVVPRVPGIPPLLGATFLPLPTLATGDQVDQGQFSKRWGVFRGGQSVAIFDSFIGIDYRQGWTLADFPLEQGAFESYDKVALPFDVRVKFAAGGSLQNREALLQSVASISKTLDLYDVVTPEVVYTSVNVQHYDYRRTATNGNGLITIELWLLEVRISATPAAVITGGANATDGTATNAAGASVFTSGAPPLTSTFDPSGRSPFNVGGVQTQVGTPAQISTIASAGLQ
jgi:hypothetical protein